MRTYLTRRVVMSLMTLAGVVLLTFVLLMIMQNFAPPSLI